MQLKIAKINVESCKEGILLMTNYQNIQEELYNRYENYQKKLEATNSPYQNLGINGRERIEDVITENGFLLRKHTISASFKENNAVLYSGIVTSANENGEDNNYFISDFRVPNDDVRLPVYGGYVLNLENGNVEVMLSNEKPQLAQDAVKAFDMAKEQATMDGQCFA